MNWPPPQDCKHRKLLNLPGRGFRAVGDKDEEEGKSMRESEKDGKFFRKGKKVGDSW